MFKRIRLALRNRKAARLKLERRERDQKTRARKRREEQSTREMVRDLEVSAIQMYGPTMPRIANILIEKHEREDKYRNYKAPLAH